MAPANKAALAPLEGRLPSVSPTVIAAPPLIARPTRGDPGIMKRSVQPRCSATPVVPISPACARANQISSPLICPSLLGSKSSAALGLSAGRLRGCGVVPRAPTVAQGWFSCLLPRSAEGLLNLRPLLRAHEYVAGCG